MIAGVSIAAAEIAVAGFVAADFETAGFAAAGFVAAGFVEAGPTFGVVCVAGVASVAAHSAFASVVCQRQMTA